MSTKRKQYEWKQCTSCFILVLSQDTSNHLLQCNTSCNLKHGYINNGVLHAITSVKETKSEIVLDEAIFLHPSTMTLCELYIGGPAVIDNSFVVKCYPSKLVHPTQVCASQKTLESLGKMIGSEILVCKIRGEIAQAKSILLNPQTFIVPPEENELFIEFLQKKLANKIISVGYPVNCLFYGKQFTGVVETIVTESPTNAEALSVKSHSNSRVESLANRISDYKSRSPSHMNEIANQLADISLTPTIGSPSTNQDKKLSANLNLSSNHFDENLSMLSPRPSDNSLLFCTPKRDSARPPVESNTRFFKVTENTKISVLNPLCRSEETNFTPLTFNDIGGLDEQIKIVKQFVTLPLEQSETYKHYGLSLPKGILLYGPSGVGKSMLLTALANELQVTVLSISAPKLWSKFYGETETRLRQIFQEACNKAPSLILIDEFDAICFKRDKTQSDLEKRVTSTLLTLFDGLHGEEQKSVTVVMVTRDPDSLDVAIRRPGRIDKEVEIPVPSASHRNEILRKILVQLPNNLSSEELREISDNTHGFVGADLAALCKEASLFAMTNMTGDTAIAIDYAAMRHARGLVKPSALREVQLDVPKVLWTDIGGQHDVKLKLRQAIEWPLKHPEAFSRLGITPAKGILLYGPPGCSKTMIAKAVATESSLNFIAVKGPELFSKWVGESEKAVREVFRKGRNSAPSIIFFDEIDALAVERGSSSGGGSNVADRVLAQLLTEIDGIEKLRDVVIIAATNRPDLIDKALLRPGRIDRIIYIPLPDEETRREIFHIRFTHMPIAEDVSIEDLVRSTERYSGAEVTALCHEAAMQALEEDINIQTIHQRHFNSGLGVVRPRISDELMKFYEEYSSTSSLHHV